MRSTVLGAVAIGVALSLISRDAVSGDTILFVSGMACGYLLSGVVPLRQGPRVTLETRLDPVLGWFSGMFRL